MQQFAIITLVTLLSAIHGVKNVVKKPLKSGEIKTIVLDAGHGGKDSGCRGKHTLEKDVALSITKKVGQQLALLHPDVKIIYTRDRDVFIPLHQRSKIANDAKADLFVSIHCNAVKNPKIKGTETYVMGLHRAKENLEVAKRENEAIYLENDYQENYDGYDPNSPIGHIMLSSVQNAHLDQSIALASKVETAIRSCSHESRGVKQAGFVVLRQATMPSILIETGFLTNNDDEECLSSDDGQESLALEIALAISTLIKDSRTIASQPTTQPQLTEQSRDEQTKNQLTEQSRSEQSQSEPTVQPELTERSRSEQTKNQLTEQSRSEQTRNEQSPSQQHPYAVQVAALRTPPSAELKAALSKLPALHIAEHKGLYKITTGHFATLQEAMDHQEKMRKAGHKGAFVVKR